MALATLTASGTCCRCLGWEEYLLPPQEAAAVGRARLVAAPNANADHDAVGAGQDAADMQQQQQQQQQDTATNSLAGAEQRTAAGAAAVETEIASSSAARTGLDIDTEVVPASALQQPSQQPAPLQQQQQEQQQQSRTRPVQWFEQQPGYPFQLLGLAVAWIVTMVLVNTLMLTVPITLGRAMFERLSLPFKNDIFTGETGQHLLACRMHAGL